jgi:transcriptional regulator with PAS, ATPase and Fis domain
MVDTYPLMQRELLKKLQLNGLIIHILDHVYDGIIIASKDTTVVYVNPAYARILGISPEKLIGQKLSLIEPNAKALSVFKDGKPIIDKHSYIETLKAEVRFTSLPLPSSKEIYGVITILTSIRWNENEPKGVNYEQLVTEYLTDELLLREPLPPEFDALTGNDKEFKKSLHRANRASKTDLPILMRGDSGTGKELLAQAICKVSNRSQYPIVEINCAAIPDTLLEAELFGYEKGAFTGANQQGKRGLFEVANNGTIFLDEIGDISLSMQAKLLRVLQQSEFKKLGGIKNIKVNVRVISATNKNLEELLRKGGFREDIYYRLNTISISLPPLCQRGSDIELLIEHFVELFNEKYHKEIKLSKRTIQLLKAYSWPGNVRELKNVIEYAIIMTDTDIVKQEHLPQYLVTNKDENRTELFSGLSYNTNDQEGAFLERILKSIEAEAIKQAIERTRNKTEAIRLLGMSRRAFYYKLRKYNEEGLG